MLGETNAKVFADVSFKEGCFGKYHRSVVLFWDVSKTNQT
jgi:hypothetical protein